MSENATLKGKPHVAVVCPLCGAGKAEEVGEKDGYAIVSCVDCGLRYVHNMPSGDELNVFYAKYSFNEKNKINSKRKVWKWYRKLLPLRLLVGRGDFLDVGCNTGFAVEAARKLGFCASGCDLSVQAISMAKELYPGCEFFNGMATDAAQRGRRFDAVLCSEMIEHLTELESLIKSLSYLVKPKGILYLTTPDAGEFKTSSELLAWKEICPPEHLMYFGRSQIKLFLKNAGFDVLYFMPVWRKSSIRVLARKL